MPGEQRSSDVATLTVRPPGAAGEAGKPVLFVIDDGVAARHELTPGASLRIGRAPENEVVLQERAASRRHAELTLQGNDVVVVDLGSHNGTQVNGVTIVGPTKLAAGDVVTIGEASLVVRRSFGLAPRREAASAPHFERAIEEEIERSAQFARPVAVAVLRFEGPVSQTRVQDALVSTARGFDRFAWGPDRSLRVALPEAAREVVEACVAGWATALRPLGLRFAVGLARAPEDGASADALVHAATRAAGHGESGTRWADDREALQTLGGRELVIGDPAMVRLYELLARLARSALTVLLLGPTGAGKELAAHAIHAGSPRAAGRLLALNCAAIPETLFESELFGHERGAFSGAVASKVGLVEQAAGGTLFLDEIAELTPAGQAKLLRFLETGRYFRVGDVKEREADVRIVAATCRDLQEEVKAGRFRQDLYFRIRVARVELPPLAERAREVPILARRFAGAKSFSLAALYAMERYPWPGNVRELKSAVEFAAATADGEVIEAWNLPTELLGEAAMPAPDAAPDEEPAPPAVFRPIEEELAELERRRMLEALRVAAGVQKRAAELLRMPLRTFVTRMKQYAIDPRGP